MYSDYLPAIINYYHFLAIKYTHFANSRKPFLHIRPLSFENIQVEKLRGFCFCSRTDVCVIFNEILLGDFYFIAPCRNVFQKEKKNNIIQTYILELDKVP